MEILKQPGQASKPGWVSRLFEVLQPIGLRADRLASTGLFSGLPWSEMEFAASCLGETPIKRGCRMTIQGQELASFWLILEGRALVSADARPLRVAMRGDVVGLSCMLHGVKSTETTVALSSIHAFEADRAQLARLMSHRRIRLRLASL
jgi:CRP-like cAMP-binding protein